VTVTTDRPIAPPVPRSRAVRDQATVASGQIVAGIGNMVFSLVMARLLVPGAFAQMASFLALYLLLSMPASAISALAALEPDRAARLRPTLLLGGAAAGLALAAASPWVGPALRLPVAMVVVLGLSGPALGTLALDRGRLYGWNRYAQLVASLAVEPAIRLLLGIGLAALGGAVGGALGVTVAGYGALEVARRHWPDRSAAGAHVHRRRTAPAIATDETASDEPFPVVSPASRAALWTALAFLAVVVVQNQDLLIANRVLGPLQAGQFAVLSTLGGLSIFATMTVPLVLLPRSARGEAGLLPALFITALIGAAAVGVVAVAPGPLVDALFGPRYHGVAGVLVPYVGAMSLLGLARVLVAHRCATGVGRSSLILILGAVVAQATLILTFGHDPRSVAYSTVAAVSGLTVSLGTAELLHWATLRRWVSIAWSRVRTAPGVVGLCAVAGLVLRLVVPRGLWIDEATSVDQARMSFAGMITNLRTTDVHPPLYFAILWGAVRWLGSGELAVRLPSIVAGTLVVPMLYILGREAYDRRTGVVAAAAGSVAPIMVWYSQEARMYALLMLFGVIAMWAQLRILRSGGRLPWVIYTLASVALVWSQYFGALQVVVQQLAFLWVIGRRYRSGRPVRGLVIGWAVSAVTMVVLIAPLVPFAYQQFMVNQTGGKGFGAPQQTGSAASLSNNHLTIYSALANLLWAVWGYHSNAAMALLAALWPLGMLFALVLLGRRHQRVTTLLVAALLIPGVIMFALGSVKQNLFDIRYLSTTVPILFVLLARMVTGISRRTVGVAIGCGVLLLTLVVGLVDQQFNGANPRTYDFRAALAPIEAQARANQAVILYDPVDLREVIQYYAPRPTLETVAGHAHQPAGTTIYVLASPALMNGAADKSTLNRAVTELRAHHHLVVHQHLPNVELWEFR
jgi:O-antigen/teichoic acid export membrane protein